jgi:uncharacterized membrane protein (DUF4010 family)
VEPLSGLVVEAAYATGIGLAIGLEREHSDLGHDVEPGGTIESEQPERNAHEVPLGARTFALLAVVGWMLAKLGDANAMIQPFGMVVVVGLLTSQFVIAARRAKDFTIGLTTEIAAIAVLCLGAMVHTDRRIAVVIAIAVALLLVSKPWMRTLVVKMRRVEITATVQLAVLVAIMLPLLPTDPIDPWGALPPRKIGMYIVLLAGVEYVGYVLTRILGPRRGAVVTGLVGGLSSSTAVTVSMARIAKASPPSLGAAQLATLLANLVMCIRVAVIIALLAPAVAWKLAIALGAMALVIVVAAMIQYIKLRRDDGTTVDAPTLKNPFALVPALTWGAILCAVLLIAKISVEQLGEQGFYLAAAASGLADVDAITLAAARGATSGAVSADAAALAVVIAVTANGVAKSTMALTAGGRAFGRRIAIALIGSALAAVAVALIGIATS